MGQGHSGQVQHVSIEQLSQRLTQRFANQCYTPLELYCFKSVFKSLADTESGVKYWSEATLCRFLELPDSLGVGPVIYQMATYLGAFPFPSQAPAILTAESLLKVVTILTERYRGVLKRGRRDWYREIYRSLAVYDRGASIGNVENTEKEAKMQEEKGTNHGFDVDEAVDDEGEAEDHDELVLAAFESMEAIDAFKVGEKANVHHSIIPSDNFLRLLELLLLVAPMEAQESPSTYAADLSDTRLESLRRTANNILSSFGVEKNHGITYRTFDSVVSSTLPYLMNGLNPLFLHFLFAKDFDLSRRKASISSNSATTLRVAQPPPTTSADISADPAPQSPRKPSIPREPLLPSEADILDLDILSQLSFFLPPSSIFRRLRLLYSGNDSGFSMGSFEKSVFNWRAPSILLVSGTLLPSPPKNPRERVFTDSMPPQRLPNSSSKGRDSGSDDSRLIFGAYVPVPWKQTHKTCFGDSSTLLFQLAPMHDVFRASSASTDYIYFNKAPSAAPGLGFGSPCPQQKPTSSYGGQSKLALGPVSLHLDDALEFGVFTHLSSGGGSFLPSSLPSASRAHQAWQDRFEIDALEVWGCDGSEEAEAQRKAWAWEEREAEMRRRVNIGGTGDIEADRELLKMAGIISGDRSGGSMG